jgi:hypothetical protein
LEHEREDVGVSPDVVGEQSVTSGKVGFIDKKPSEEEEGNDKGSDKDGRVPAFDRRLGEAENEAV